MSRKKRFRASEKKARPYAMRSGVSQKR